eukprot:11483451-Alexandrium_andersonii.AAC.1
MSASEWRSLRGDRATWSEDDVASVAQGVIAGLPERARSLLQSGSFQGGVVLALKDTGAWQ